jgi:hypothetical protein
MSTVANMIVASVVGPVFVSNAMKPCKLRKRKNNRPFHTQGAAAGAGLFMIMTNKYWNFVHVRMKTKLSFDMIFFPFYFDRVSPDQLALPVSRIRVHPVLLATSAMKFWSPRS